jgi:Protein of unknown function (DUF2911)
MKNKMFLTIATICLFLSIDSFSQKNNEKRKSPRVTTKQVLDSGAEIAISYGQPQIKGRTIGKDIEPMEDKIWRTGADEATVFETNKAIKINGQSLPAGKYSFFTKVKNREWLLIFNTEWDQWGAYKHKEHFDLLKVSLKPQTNSFTEKMTFTIEKNGQIALLWGDAKVAFTVE